MKLLKLRLFRDTMRENQIAVYSYRYKYNNVSCFVAVCLLNDEDKTIKKTEYSLVRLRFMKTNNLSDFIDCYANTNGFQTSVSEIRRFFNIPYDTQGFRSWLDQFYSDFDQKFPVTISAIDDELQQINIRTVCEHEKRDPNRIYRHHLMRHLPDKTGKIKHRTEYNSQLAKWRFPKLWEIYKSDNTVSFAFTDDRNAEMTEEQIYANFIKIDSARLK